MDIPRKVDKEIGRTYKEEMVHMIYPTIVEIPHDSWLTRLVMVVGSGTGEMVMVVFGKGKVSITTKKYVGR